MNGPTDLEGVEAELRRDLQGAFDAYRVFQNEAKRLRSLADKPGCAPDTNRAYGAAAQAEHRAFEKYWKALESFTVFIKARHPGIDF